MAVLDSTDGSKPCCPDLPLMRMTSSRSTKPTTRSLSPSRTARSTPTGRSSTLTPVSSLMESSALHPGTTDILTDLEPGVFRQHDDGQRQHMAISSGRAAALPLTVPQWLSVALPDPRLQPDPWGGSVADRQRRRLLAAPVNITATNGNRLLMGLAERADVIVDFTNVDVGNYVLENVGPDEPFGGGEPVTDIPPPDPDDLLEGQFLAADPDTTRQIMQFRVVPAVGPDPSTPPENLVLPLFPHCHLKLSPARWRLSKRRG